MRMTVDSRLKFVVLFFCQYQLWSPSGDQTWTQTQIIDLTDGDGGGDESGSEHWQPTKYKLVGTYKKRLVGETKITL